MKNIQFIIAAYGEEYSRFLYTLLYSIQKHYPHAKAEIHWNEISSRNIFFLEKLYPRFQFVEYRQSIRGTIEEKIPLKLRMWDAAFQKKKQGLYCFLDCDMLIVKPFYALLPKKVDVIYTWKEGMFQLNTGVMIIECRERTKKFMSFWREKTEQIVSNKKLLAEACQQNGAADQHALWGIIGENNFHEQKKRSINGNEILFQGIPCEYLNETRSVPLTEKTHIIHYKSGWHPILLESAKYTKNRPEKESKEMYDFWLKNKEAADKEITKAFILRTVEKDQKKFEKFSFAHEERDILNSEMLAFCSLCKQLGIEVIIESGRCKGQSTKYAEKKLISYKNVELIYADSTKIIATLLKRYAGKKIAIILDEPKGQVAVNLLMNCFSSPDVYLGAIHAAKKGTIARQLMPKLFPVSFYTDDRDFVERYKNLDMSAIVPENEVNEHSWRPYMKGEQHMESYGPTLAIIFPLFIRKKNSLWHLFKSWVSGHLKKCL